MDSPLSSLSQLRGAAASQPLGTPSPAGIVSTVGVFLGLFGTCTKAITVLNIKKKKKKERK